MHAAVYLRISQDRTGEGLAVDRQREGCLEVCRQRGWDALEYVDNDTSASSGAPREHYERMLSDIEQGNVQAVVCWHLDRLHRRPVELERFMVLAERHDLKLATVTGDVDLSTDDGQFMARIMGAVARKEVDRKAARQRAAAKQTAQAGKGWGGRRAFGYTRRPKDGEELSAYVSPGGNDIVPDEAKLIRQAYKDIKSGNSLYSVAKQWNSAGVTTTVGKQWSGSTVRQVLVNPRYMGQRSYRDEFMVKAQWEPLVPEALWQTVVAILTDTKRNTGRTPGRKYLLTGLLVCGNCATTMGSGLANSDHAAVYSCKGCLRNSRRQAPVDELVTGLAVNYLSRPDVVDVLLTSDREDITELREQERMALDRIAGFEADYADGDITGKQLKAATERVEEQLAEVRAQMVDANRSRVFDGLLKAKDVGRWFDGLTLDRKRSVLSTLMVPTLQPAGRGRPFHRDHLTVQWLTADD